MNNVLLMTGFFLWTQFAVAQELPSPSGIEIEGSIKQVQNVTLTTAIIDLDQNGIDDTLTLQLSSGAEVVDEAPCAGCGHRFEGKFVVLVQMNGAKTSRTRLNQFFQRSELSFWAKPWSISFADYNHDGILDFNLGQFENSNNWEYRLFTVTPSGKVKSFPLPDGAIYVCDDSNSTNRIFQTQAGFWYKAFSNGEEAGWHQFFLNWNTRHKQFELVQHRHSMDEPESPASY